MTAAIVASNALLDHARAVLLEQFKSSALFGQLLGNYTGELQTLEQEIQALNNQIDGARVYAVEQIIAQYSAALQDVTTRQQIKIVLEPGALLYAPPEADITQAVTTALNAKVPSVGVVPPAGWQPSREGVQIFQEVQQRLIAASIAQQQQQAAGAQPQGNPAAPTGR